MDGLFHGCPSLGSCTGDIKGCSEFDIGRGVKCHLFYFMMGKSESKTTPASSPLGFVRK